MGLQRRLSHLQVRLSSSSGFQSKNSAQKIEPKITVFEERHLHGSAPFGIFCVKICAVFWLKVIGKVIGRSQKTN